MKKLRPLNQDQSGLVAIVITMIVIILLSLIVLTFARIAQREQRQTLDRQLNTLAFYAAESGVNDAREWIKSNPTTRIENCDLPSSWPAPRVLDGTDGVLSYSCVLIDPTPRTLEYGNINVGQAKVVPVERSDGNNIGSVQIHWQDAGGDDNFSCPSDHPSTWSCGPGMLQIDMIAFNKTGSGNINTTRDYIINNTMTVFASPSSNSGASGAVTYASARGFTGQGQTVQAGCTTSTDSSRPRHCRAVIEAISNNIAYIKITPLYKSAAVTICSPSCGSAQQLVGAQSIVDATGKANDILRRIQVRVPTSELGDMFPNSAVESSQSLCKRFSIAPPNQVSESGVPSDCRVF